MTETSHNSRYGPNRRRSRLPGILVMLFLVLNLLDLLLTRMLIVSCGEWVYEANPLPAVILNRHGWLGLASFKGLMAFSVVILGYMISQVRPRAALLLFRGACGGLGAVVAYSLAILMLQPWNLSAAQEMQAARAESNMLQEQIHDLHAYSQLLVSVGTELARGNLTLDQATTQLEEYLAQELSTYDPLVSLRHWYGQSDRACLAATLIEYASTSLPLGSPERQVRIRELLREYEEEHHVRLTRFLFMNDVPTP